MTTLAATLKLSLACSLIGSSDMTPLPRHDFIETFEMLFSDGAGADQAQNVFCDERTLAASATENLDLAASLTNALGSTITFTAIKAILIVANAGNTNNVVIGGAATNTFTGPFGDATDKINLGPGDVFLVTRRGATGLAVTADTGDILKIANSGGTTGVTYRVVIIGEN
ncbi:MAG: hypothetical protein QOH47_812 [Sphingomonadales bacterium]|jgi:hypothetical protein|nr:hypothetical protein [Sphingomonadales bacterium]